MGKYTYTTQAPCPHCRKQTDTGTRGGCRECNKVKHHSDGRTNAYHEQQARKRNQ